MPDPIFHGLELIRPISWPEAFEFWRDSEGSDPHWLKNARDRGFDSWEEWRMAYARPFRLEEREWNLFHVADPMADVPRFHGGPFKGWIERTYGDAGPTPEFRVIAERLTEYQNGYVEKLMASFPPATTVIGVATDHGIVVVEGTHRCCAIAKAAAEGRKIETDLHIALGGYLPGGLPVIGKFRKGESPI